MWTPGEVIKLALELRGQKETLAEQTKAVNGKIELCEVFLRDTMLKRGEKQIKTDDGVAFLKEQLRVTMKDRQGAIDFTLARIENNDANAFDLWTNHVVKEEVKTLLDSGVALPFLNIETFIDCNIRKA